MGIDVYDVTTNAAAGVQSHCQVLKFFVNSQILLVQGAAVNRVWAGMIDHFTEKYNTF